MLCCAGEDVVAGVVFKYVAEVVLESAVEEVVGTLVAVADIVAKVKFRNVHGLSLESA